MAPGLLELLGDGGEVAAQDVLMFTRHALHAFHDLKPGIYAVRHSHILTHTTTISCVHVIYTRVFYVRAD